MITYCCYFSVTQSCLTLQFHGLQHTRLPCPSPTPGACSNSCPLSWWCHLTISANVTHFSSYPQSYPASGSFPISQLFASGDQNIGALASASVLPMNIEGWFPLGLIGLISLLSKWPSRVYSSTTIWKHRFFGILCTTGPDLFTEFTDETWFTGKQESPLLKCFSDCAPTIRKQVRKVLGNPWTYYKLHYFDGRLSSLIVENNDLKV